MGRLAWIAGGLIMATVFDALAGYTNALDPSAYNFRRDFQGSETGDKLTQYQLENLQRLLSGAGLSGDSAGDYTYQADAPVQGMDRYFADYLSNPAGQQVAQSAPRYDAPFNFAKDLLLPAALVWGGGALGSGLLGGAGGAAAGSASSITPEMLAAANATADPIAALNAGAGWTGVDSAYLSGIGGSAATSGSGVQGALNDLVGQSQVPQGAFTVNSPVTDALDQMTGLNMSRPDFFANAIEGAGGPVFVPNVSQTVNINGTKPAPETPYPEISNAVYPDFQAPIPEIPNAVYPDFVAPQPEIPNAAYPDFVAPQPEIPNAVYPPGAGTPNLLDKIIGKVGDAASGLTAADLLKYGLLGGALAGAGNQQESYSGPMPTISRGSWAPQVQAQTMPTQSAQPQSGGLLNIKPGYANDGLWRFLNR